MAIVVGNTGNSGVLSSVSSNTTAFNNNGDDVIVLIAIRDTRTASQGSSVTYNSVSLTLDKRQTLTDDDSSSDLVVEVWRLFGAAAGSNNVAVTFSGTVDHAAIFYASVSDLNDTGQPDITGGTAHTLTSNDDPSTSVTTTAADTILFDIVYNKTGNALTKGASQTQIGNLSPNGGGDRAGASYQIVSTAGSKTMSWTTASAPDRDDWSHAVVAYKKTAGGVTTSPSAQSATFSQPAPTITAKRNINLSPGVQSITSSQPSPTVTAVRNVSVSVGVQSITSSQPAATISINESLAQAVQSATFSQPAASVSTVRNLSTSPGVQTATFSLPSPTVSTFTNATINAAVQSATLSQQPATVSTVRHVTVSPGVQSITSSQPAASVSVNEGLAQAVQTATFSLPSPTVTAVRNILISAAVQSLTASLQNPVVSFGSKIVSANVQELGFTLLSPTVNAIWNELPVYNPPATWTRGSGGSTSWSTASDDSETWTDADNPYSSRWSRTPTD